MSQSSVLLLSYCFPPQSLPEAFLSAKTMGALPGREVHVIAGERVRAWMGDDPSLLPYVGERFASVRRVGLPALWRHAPFGKVPILAVPDMMVHANARVARLARAQPADAIMTWSSWNSMHLAGLTLKRASPRLPWVAHFSDPWVGNPYARQGAILSGWNARLERKVVEAADALVFTNEATVDLVMRKYPGSWRRKAHVVPHPFDPALYPSAPPAREGPIVLRYLGGFYGPRTPRPLFRALARLAPTGILDDVRVEIIGSLPAEEVATNPYRTLPPGLVSVRGSVPYLRSLELMQEADALLVIDAPAQKSIFLPSKLVDYIGAGRPIVGLTPPGVSADILREAGAPIADPTDEKGCADALSEGIALARKLRGAAWDAGPVKQKFIVGTVGRQTAAALSAAAEGSR